jgi:hypothetical protein
VAVLVGVAVRAPGVGVGSFVGMRMDRAVAVAVKLAAKLAVGQRSGL